MAESEISRSELVRAVVQIGNLLTGPKSIEERMTGLCVAAIRVLACNSVTVMTLDGDQYRGRYQVGLPLSFAELFADYSVDRTNKGVRQIEKCDTYLLFNQARDDPTMGRVASIIGIESMIVVPFTYPDGQPLGYLVANYTTDKTDVSTEEAELAMGLARLAQTTMLRQLETERRRDVSLAMLQVADSERRRLSRDIHDDPLQRILALRIGLEGFRAQLDNEEHRETLSEFVEQCRAASSSLREVMLQTHPNVSELADLEDVLTRMVTRREFGASVTLQFQDLRTANSPSYLVPALNRIAEQAARNTMRHANASTLSVSLTSEESGTLLSIQDNGSGFDPRETDPTRLGLVSMRERTELLGGIFSIHAAPGRGTDVTAWFPHNASEEPA